MVKKESSLVWQSFSFSLLPQLLHLQVDLFRPITDLRTGSTRLEPIMVLRTIWALICLSDQESSEDLVQNASTDLDQDSFLEPDLDEGPDSNFPDVVPRYSSTPTRSAANLETFFLLSILFGTVVLLYLFPPADP